MSASSTTASPTRPTAPARRSGIWTVAAKDLRIELASRVGLGQILPFGVVVLFLFAFAIDPGRGVLGRLAPGLFWVAVLLSMLLVVGRSQANDAAPGVRDALRLSGIDPAHVFAGKVVALAAQLLALELLLAVGVAVLYDLDTSRIGATEAALIALTALATTAAVSAAGTIHGALVAGAGARESLLPLLLLPALAPVLIGATSATEAGVDGVPGEGWGWAGLVALFAVIYMVAGWATYETLMETT